MSTLATMTRDGRIAIAESMAKNPMHLAWGSGLPEWDDMEESELPVLTTRTSLFNEIGRRVVSVTGYVEPDDEGGILVPTGVMPDGSVQTARYRQSMEATPYLYFRINYDFGDAATAVIRELGICMNTEIAQGVAPGLMYFTPDQIVKPGRLLAMQILRPVILRTPARRETVEFVLPV